MTSSLDETAKTTALRLLARREHSSQELRQKLLLRKFTVAQIEPVLEYIKNHDWQSDERFAQAYVNSRMQRGDGMLKIQAHLRNCGVHKDIIAKVLAQEEAFWHQQLLQLWNKKYQAQSFKNNPLAKAKAQRFFLARGYTHEQIQRLYE